MKQYLNVNVIEQGKRASKMRLHIVFPLFADVFFCLCLLKIFVHIPEKCFVYLRLVRKDFT